MPRHNPYDISYTQANDPVDCAAKNMEMPEKDPLENMLYDKYVFNYAQLVAGSSNLVGLSSFTCEAGESDYLAPLNGWCNGIKISYMLGDRVSNIRHTSGNSFIYGDELNPRVTLIARRNIAFGAESGWVSGIRGCQYGVNEPEALAINLSYSADFLTHISGEFAAGRATHAFYALGANVIYNNHVGINECSAGQIIYSGLIDEASTQVIADGFCDLSKTIIDVVKSAGAKGIVLGGIYNRFLFPTGWSMGFQDQTSLDRVEVFVDRYNAKLKEYAEEIGAVYVDYREFQKDMQGEYNQKPYVKFPAPYQHIKVHNQTYDSVEGYIVDVNGNGVFNFKPGNRAAMFSDRGTFYYNFGQAHMNNIMLHALNKCYGTSIKLIDPTEMVLLCGLQTDFNSYSSRVQGGGSGVQPEDNDGGIISGTNSNRPDFGVDRLGSNVYTKPVTSVDFPEQFDRGRQSSIRFGGTNRPKKQDYGDRTG